MGLLTEGFTKGLTKVLGWVLVAWVGLCGAGLAWAEDFLAPEQAFGFSAQVVNDRTVRLQWHIAPGYHLYRERLSVQADGPGVSFKPLVWPQSQDKFDANFNKTMAVYKTPLAVDVEFLAGSAGVPLTVGWQGCAEAGLCYPPESRQIQVALVGLGAAHNQVTLGVGTASPTPVATSAPTEPTGGGDSIALALASGSLVKTVGLFWVAGLLLAFTPCVLPMVPILSSLIAGQSGPVSRVQGFALALAYSLGMALVYAGFGVAAGLAGEGLAAALQNPWVLGGFAVLLSGMALSMFGVYELQMPGFVQTHATAWSNRFKGGSLAGVFFMGGVSALVVGPCVAAPLAGALVYISQTRDVWLGGSALFAMALGMSVPLLLVGVSAGSLLPRAGAWMERVKQVFGMMLLGVAIWMVSPVLPAALHMLLWAVWLLAGGALLGAFGAATPLHAPLPLPARVTGMGLVALASVLLLGAASGGQSVVQPLAHWRGTSLVAGKSEASAMAFERVTSVQTLEAQLAQARQVGQPVMLDFYADWCVACKEFDAFTFSKPEVRQRLQGVRLLQADVTANSEADKALLKRFGLFGPPGIVFFDGTTARVAHKVVGYQNATDFVASVNRALGTAL